MALRRPLPTAFVAVALVACGGDDEAAAPVPLAQRFLTAADAPGTKPDPVETRQTTVDFDEFIATLSEGAVDPDKEEMTTVFREAGFKGAGEDSRFYGETHKRTAPHVDSSFIELESEDGATSALDWLETDSMKPCPTSCAVQVSTFDVDDIEGARGVHRLATAEQIARDNNPNELPFDSYSVGFTEGHSCTRWTCMDPPGSVSEEQAQEIARAYHERLTGS